MPKSVILIYFQRLLAIIVISLYSLSMSARAAELYHDDFEPVPGRTFLAGGGTMTIPNAVGFAWESNNFTSVVRDDQYAVYNNGPIMNGPQTGVDHPWTNGPGTGSHSLRFRYPAGQSQSEQRWNTTGVHPDIWMRFWLRVPNAFYHPSTNPNNQKLFAIWMDGYEGAGDGSTVWGGFLATGNGGSTFAVSNSNGRFSGSGGFMGTTSFITVPSDRGRWMQLVVHAKAETSPGATNGLIEVWRRWNGESSFTKTHNQTGLAIRLPVSGTQGFKAGYLMGWANAAYTADTEFLLDDFVLSTSSLLDATPMAPKALVAE